MEGLSQWRGELIRKRWHKILAKAIHSEGEETMSETEKPKCHVGDEIIYKYAHGAAISATINKMSDCGKLLLLDDGKSDAWWTELIAIDVVGVVRAPKEEFNWKSYPAKEVMDAAVFTFGRALQLLNEGGVVCRKGWNGNGMCCFKQNPDKNSLMTHPYLVIVIPGCTEGIRNLPWQPAQVDIFAEDWMRFN